MPLAVFLRGVNVGGQRTFRPTELARQLAHLDVVNIGAAGTFVVRKPVTRARLRAELVRRLPFDTSIMICDGRDILRLLAGDHFSDQPGKSEVVRFVSVLAKNPRSAPAMPVNIPATGKWFVRVVARERRFVIGVYRRQMKAIGYLGDIDRVFGTPATTRNWNTIAAIGKVLVGGAAHAEPRLRTQSLQRPRQGGVPRLLPPLGKGSRRARRARGGARQVP